MADAISLPTQFSFEEMLSHTFPGFFLAFSLFMLIDYLSPFDLTMLTMSSLAGTISFAGFILIIGTILGVIIDSIHHTFIEDDIFDNFEAVHKLKMPVKKQLESICPANHNNLSRHFFFFKIGDKAAKALELDLHLDKAYYRYSEFYSNIFISLTVFSLIAPFYIFEVLELSWNRSVLVGIASLIIACLCLKGSYTSYTTYLKALSSATCGFIKEAESGCTLGCKEMSIDRKQESSKFIILGWEISIAISIIITCSLYLLKFPFNGLAFFIGTIILGGFGTWQISKYIFHDKSDDSISILFFLKNIFKKYSEFDSAKESINQLEKNRKIIENGEKVKTDLHDLIYNCQINNVEELREVIKKLKKDISEQDRDKKDEILSSCEKIKKYLNDLAQNKIIEANKFSDDIQKLISNIREQDRVILDNFEKAIKYLNDLNNQLLKAKELSINSQKIIDNLIEPDNGNIWDKLSKSSPAALFSFMVSLFAFMIVLFLSSAPINLNVETSSINFEENITDETTLKNPIATLSFKNLGAELNKITLNTTGFERKWLKFSYVNDEGMIKKEENLLFEISNTSTGESEFVQIRLDSSDMDRKNIYPGSYLGSIDIDYEDKRKSIPICINLTKN